MYKLLLLTDFSAASRHAIAFAQALFADTAADFCFMNACSIEPSLQDSGAFLLNERWLAAEKLLNELQRELTQQPEPTYHTYRTITMIGEPVDSVNKLLDSESFDMVVVGATGHGWSELMGSVATDAVQTIKTNVLVVPTAAAIRPLQQIVLATNYRSVNSTTSLTFLDDLASRKGAQLTLLTIEDPNRSGTQAEPGRQRVLDAFEDVRTDTYMIHDDNVLRGIDTYLKTHTVDLLVLLPHHKSLFDVVSGKSVSRSVAYHPHAPLLALYDKQTTEQNASTDTFDLDKIPFATYL
ncbi:universal stress protein [Spirosoma sp. SC4-14]|uniref:universal stress protein n=1 Tax=Spirosoma sp. SC4-14 TaxID=3128900 RepID=UPI0030CC4023